MRNDNDVKKTDSDRCYTVYKHTNKINGKCYIGITCRKPKKRWGKNGRQYLNKTPKGNYCQPKFANALLKYSWDNFEHEILHINLTQNEAMQKERELIKQYDSIANGYNIEIGGNCVSCTTEKPVKQYTKEGLFVREYESIIKAAETLNINRSEIGGCCNNINKTAGNYIWRFSTDVITKEYLEWCNNSRRGEHRIAVCQYSRDGAFIKKYDSVSSAAKAVNGRRSNISRCCNNMVKTASGYVWRYDGISLTKEHLEWCNIPRNKHIQRNVSQYTKEGTFICTYSSVKNASSKTGINANVIAKCCRNEAKSAGSFLWRYSEDKITEEYVNWCNTRKEQFWRGLNGKEVCQYTLNGNFVSSYNSLTEAGRKTGVNRDSISAVCKGNKIQAGNFIWKFASDIVDSTMLLSSNQLQLT